MKVTEHPMYATVEKWLKDRGAEQDKDPDGMYRARFRIGNLHYLVMEEKRDLLISCYKYGFIVPDTEEKFLELMKILEPALA